MTRYAELLPYCRTDKDKEAVDACMALGSQRAAASKMGVNIRGLERRLANIRQRAASQGFAPDHDMTKTAPEGFHTKGVSTLYDSDGQVKQQWVKTQQDAQNRLNLLQEACEDALGDIKPLPSVKAPKKVSKSLLTVYPMGDPHIGMYAWAEEAGEDFDAEKAREDLLAAVDRLVDVAPPADTAIILNLGDFFHADNMDNKTRRSGNALDVDTRWAKVLDIGIDAMTRVIRRALEKHKRVVVRNNIGNHDEHSSIMLSIALRAYFRDNKRVEIDTSPDPFWFFQFGKTLIGSTHGDRTKPADLPGIMATDKSKEWGETVFRYWYTGHVHHQSKHEFRGCTVESFRTLAAKDAWHHGEGYRSGRDMRCLVIHDQHGEIECHRVGVEQL